MKTARHGRNRMIDDETIDLIRATLHAHFEFCQTHYDDTIWELEMKTGLDAETIEQYV
jgi:hypothetical protein